VHRERPELCLNEWIPHHESASAHKELSVREYLTRNSIIELEHGASSPDLVPNDLWLFLKIKSAMK
jgi:hypothetical protein